MKRLALLSVLLSSISALPVLAGPRHQQPARSNQGNHAAVQVGAASWYGRWHAGRLTASGERFDPQAMTCAHRTLPLGTVVKVTDVSTGRSVSLEVNDRGPYVRGRILDLSEGAARVLGVEGRGVALVRVEPVGAVPGSQGGQT